MKIYIEINEARDEIKKYIQSEEYKDLFKTLEEGNKEQIFQATCCLLPLILLSKCPKYINVGL